MSQQTWMITFNSDAEDTLAQKNLLRDYLLDASPANIQEIPTPGSKYAQGDWTNIITTIVTSGATVAAVNAISTWIKATHNADINIEIQDDQKKIKIDAKHITRENYKETLKFIKQELMKQLSVNSSEKKEP